MMRSKHVNSLWTVPEYSIIGAFHNILRVHSILLFENVTRVGDAIGVYDDAIIFISEETIMALIVNSDV